MCEIAFNHIGLDYKDYLILKSDPRRATDNGIFCGDTKKLSFGQKLAITLLGGFIGDKLGILGGSGEDIGLPRDVMPEGRVLEGIVNPYMTRVYNAGSGPSDVPSGDEIPSPMDKDTSTSMPSASGPHIEEVD